MIRLGVDLGGSKTEIIALDERRNELLRRREPTPAGDYEATLDLIAQLVRETEIEIGKRGSIGIGTPGSLSPASGLLRNSNSTCLNGRPIKADLERRLGREIRIANDANCFVLSEATDGAARGAQTVFGVILGTGVGGGIWINGNVIAGTNGIAGEWGHNALPWIGPNDETQRPCYCGKINCIETFLSGSALVAAYKNLSSEAVSVEEIDKRARAGETHAVTAVAQYENRLGRALASVINVLDPEVVVLGGGLSNIDHLYGSVHTLWSEWVFSDVIATKLVRNYHGDSSGVRGAALLWELPVH